MESTEKWRSAKEIWEELVHAVVDLGYSVCGRHIRVHSEKCDWHWHPEAHPLTFTLIRLRGDCRYFARLVHDYGKYAQQYRLLAVYSQKEVEDAGHPFNERYQPCPDRLRAKQAEVEKYHAEAKYYAAKEARAVHQLAQARRLVEETESQVQRIPTRMIGLLQSRHGTRPPLRSALSTNIHDLVTTI